MRPEPVRFKSPPSPSASLPITATCSGSSWSCPSQIKYPVQYQCTSKASGESILTPGCISVLQGYSWLGNDLQPTHIYVIVSLSDQISFRCPPQASFDVHTQPCQQSMQRFCVFKSRRPAQRVTKTNVLIIEVFHESAPPSHDLRISPIKNRAGGVFPV